MIRALCHRLQRLVQRVRVTRVDTSGGIQRAQFSGLWGAVRDRVDHLQPYGFTSRPHPGADGLSLAVGEDHAVLVVVDDRRYRLRTLADGEVAIYDDLGNVIALKRDQVQVTAVQHLDVAAPTATITATTTHIGNVAINGNVTVNGTLDATGQIDSATGISSGGIELTTHTHPGDSGGNTGGPQ